MLIRECELMQSSKSSRMPRDSLHPLRRWGQRLELGIVGKWLTRAHTTHYLMKQDEVLGLCDFWVCAIPSPPGPLWLGMRWLWSEWRLQNELNYWKKAWGRWKGVETSLILPLDHSRCRDLKEWPSSRRDDISSGSGGRGIWKKGKGYRLGWFSLLQLIDQSKIVGLDR